MDGSDEGQTTSKGNMGWQSGRQKRRARLRREIRITADRTTYGLKSTIGSPDVHHSEAALNTKSGVSVLKPRPIVVFFSSLLTLLAVGCTEDPNPVGAKLLPAGDLLHIDTTVVTGNQSYNQAQIAATALSLRVLVGHAKSTQCWGILQFTSPPDSIRYATMIGAELQLRVNYHFGDSLAAFGMAIHQITQYWVSDSLTIDSLRAAGFYNAAISGSMNARPVGDTETVIIPIDTTMVRGWGTISDTVITNHGLLLDPAGSTVVKGFASFLAEDATQRPLLRLLFRDVAGNIDTLVENSGSSRFVTTGLDPTWATDATHLYVMNGGADWGFVGFDVSALPARAAVHKAVLELTLDGARSQLNSYTTDSTYAYFIADSGAVQTTVAAIGTPTTIGSSRVYQFPVGSIVQRWLRGSTQHKFAIGGYTESSTLDLFSYYGAQSAAALKPKLTIIYSVLQ